MRRCVQAIGRQPQRPPAGAPVHYESHRPEQTTLYRVVQQHAASFMAHTEASTGAELPRFIKDEFDAFLECGILAHGFLRLRCSAGVRVAGDAAAVVCEIGALPGGAITAPNCAARDIVALTPAPPEKCCVDRNASIPADRKSPPSTASRIRCCSNRRSDADPWCACRSRRRAGRDRRRDGRQRRPESKPRARSRLRLQAPLLNVEQHQQPALSTRLRADAQRVHRLGGRAFDAAPTGTAHEHHADVDTGLAQDVRRSAGSTAPAESMM